MHGDFWLRMLGLIGIVGSMFAFPMITLWRDERRREREAINPTDSTERADAAR